METGVLGLVDHAHPAAAELLEDVVVGDGLADHQGQILRGGKGQVNEACEGSAGGRQGRRVPSRQSATFLRCS
jgi:hypothetical protein